jgi:competence protein ComEA
VSGQVQNPGVVQLPSGSRVQAAVEAAGGFAPGADFEALNLAALLVDGQKVVVPALNSETPANSEISQDSRTGSAVLAQDGFPIDLNTADQLTLEKLPGVGPVTAQAIIEYRLKNGPFTTLEDLDEVSGIGPETIEQIKDLVIIQP